MLTKSNDSERYASARSAICKTTHDVECEEVDGPWDLPLFLFDVALPGLRSESPRKLPLGFGSALDDNGQVHSTSARYRDHDHDRQYPTEAAGTFTITL